MDLIDFKAVGNHSIVERDSVTVTIISVKQ